MKKIITEAFSVNLIIVLMLSIFAGFSVWGSRSVNTFADNGPVYKGGTVDKKISLMINVYQNTDIVEQMVEVLNKEEIKATFFVGGCWACKNTETLKLISENGNELGNHGYNHKLHTKLSKEDNISEITRTNSLIKEVTGKTCTLFAPPSGDVDEKVTEYASQCGCETIMWSCDTIDWRDNDTDKIFSRVKRNLAPGVFILMHPTEATLDILPEIITYIKQEGYGFITVGESLEKLKIT